MEALLTTLDTLLVQPLSPTELCRNFYRTSGNSLTKACGERPCDFLCKFPSRYAVSKEMVARTMPPLPASTLKPWLLASGAAVAPSSELPAAFAAAVEDLCFRAEIVLGGSVGRGTATQSVRDFELLLLFEGMPAGTAWAGPTLAALKAMLGTVMLKVDGQEIPVLVRRTADTSIECCVGGEKAVVSVGVKGGEAEQLGSWVRGQPSTTVRAVRLVKEWASRQLWSSPYLTPPPLLLELLVIHSAEQHPHYPLPDLVAAVHELLKEADFLEVNWGLQSAQTPSVLHPFSGANLMDTSEFDSAELVAFARAVNSVEAAYAGHVRAEDSESTASFVSASSSSGGDTSGDSD